MFNGFNNRVTNNLRPIVSTHWSTGNQYESQFECMTNRLKSISISSSDAESLIGNSPTVSPFGSPVKYSVLNWPEPASAFNGSLDLRELNGEKLSSLEIERINSKNDFNKNGIEVPLQKSSVYNLMDCNQSVQMANTYELFGKNNFTYANVKPSAFTPLAANESIIGLKSKQRRRQKTQIYCAFCKNNNETPEMYNSHILKDPEGKTICPVLRKYDCPVCRNGGGDYAHTIRYCPMNKAGQQIPSVIKMLKNSRSADGRKRNI